jgi:xylan 1,4-beta-xylosidase
VTRLLPLLFCAALSAQTFPVSVTVDAARPAGAFPPAWAMFGYDEPNYTYMKDGRKLLTQLAELSPAPVYVRAHNLLSSGDGTAALKWGSTNAYTEDAQGRARYDWTILDRIFDTYIERGMKPLVEIGFMPEALSSKPQPYRHAFSLVPLNQSILGGWAYPPKDYDKWGELVFQWVRHAVERYGAAEVESWLWEVWNEPNIGYWRGTPEEFYRLYDTSVAAVRRALPKAQVGGPNAAGASDEKGLAWFRNFLNHVRDARVPLDFVAFHAKGSPNVSGDHVRMGLGRQLQVLDAHFRILASYPEFKSKPIIIGESDPEGCAACSSRVFPRNAYRNGTLYSSYTAAVFPRHYDLAAQHGLSLRGIVTWAFEFEDQPWFDGFRDLATNGVAKPVLNVFRMFGLMETERVAATSSAALPLDTITRDSVRATPDVGVLATRGPRSVSALVWHYHDDDVAGPAADVALRLSGTPARVRLEHYRIDQEHANSYAVWLRMGLPQRPTAEQVAALERASELTPMVSPAFFSTARPIQFSLPRQAVSLLRFTW